MDKYEERRLALKALADQLGRGALAAIAQKIGKDPSYVSRMLYPPQKAGYKRIGEDTLEALAIAFPTHFGAPRQDVYATPPISPPPLTEESAPHGYVRLPVMAEASAGPGRAPLQEVIQHIDVLESYIRQRLHANPSQIKVLTARGNSMRGVIEDGDIMFVEPTCEFTDDGIYILTLDELIRVKRLSVSMATGKVLIESNDGRLPEELPLKEVQHRLHIQGRVLGAWSLRSFA